MKRPIEHEYNSFVSYARELEKYCSELEAAAQQALEQFKKITWARPVSKSPSKLVEQLETMALMGAAGLTAALKESK